MTSTLQFEPATNNGARGFIVHMRCSDTDGREAALRSTLVTSYIYPDEELVRETFEGATTFETHLIIKLTGQPGSWKPLDISSGLNEPSLDLVVQYPDGTALDVYIKFFKSNKLRWTQRRDSQPATHLADAISTLKSARVHTDGDSL